MRNFKRLVNILFVSITLGCVVACKPAAGRATGKKMSYTHALDVDPDVKEGFDPVPFWGEDPIKVLAQKGHFWYGYDKEEKYFMGFACDKSGTLYACVKCNYDTISIVHSRYAEDFWLSTQDDLDLDLVDPKTGIKCWHKVQWTDNNHHTFTLPSLDWTYTYQLDLENKVLKKLWGSDLSPNRVDLLKLNVAPRVDLTQEMENVLTKENKIWTSGGYCYCRIFYYDKNYNRLYTYACSNNSSKKSTITKALKKKNFKSDVGWSVLYQDSDNPFMFYLSDSAYDSSHRQKAYCNAHSLLIVDVANQKLSWVNYHFQLDDEPYLYKTATSSPQKSTPLEFKQQNM